MLRKNVASQVIGFAAINATTGATMTGTTGFAAFRCIDGGAQAAATGSVTDKGNGQYSFALSQADTNGNDISILFTMTGMVAVEKTFITTACDPTTATNFGITNLDAAISTRSTPTNITAGTITTVTNLTNAPTAGDFTATMKTSITTAATAATPTVTAGTVTDKTGYSLAASQHVIVDSGTVTTLTNLPAITANWLTASGINAGALNGKGDWLLSSSYTAPPSSATISGAVWDVTLASHLTAGTTGFALNAAGSAGDPWGTALPGSYGAGTAGKILGSNLDVAVSTRSTYAGGPVASVTGTVNATLVSTGLDAIAITAPTGPATTFREMVVQTWRRFFKGSAKDASGLTLKTFADNGTTVVTTQTFADDGAGTETLGAAS